MSILLGELRRDILFQLICACACDAYVTLLLRFRDAYRVSLRQYHLRCVCASVFCLKGAALLPQVTCWSTCAVAATLRRAGSCKTASWRRRPEARDDCIAWVHQTLKVTEPFCHTMTSRAAMQTPPSRCQLGLRSGVWSYPPADKFTPARHLHTALSPRTAMQWRRRRQRGQLQAFRPQQDVLNFTHPL